MFANDSNNLSLVLLFISLSSLEVSYIPVKSCGISQSKVTEDWWDKKDFINEGPKLYQMILVFQVDIILGYNALCIILEPNSASHLSIPLDKDSELEKPLH